VGKVLFVDGFKTIEDMDVMIGNEMMKSKSKGFASDLFINRTQKHAKKSF